MKAAAWAIVAMGIGAALMAAIWAYHDGMIIVLTRDEEQHCRDGGGCTVVTRQELNELVQTAIELGAAARGDAERSKPRDGI